MGDATRDYSNDKLLHRHFRRTETNINRHVFGYSRLAQHTAVLRQGDGDITFRQDIGHRPSRAGIEASTVIVFAKHRRYWGPA